jgi:fatty-acyl-CoA synthase
VVRHQNVRLTYAELRLKVDALACGLRRLGLAPGAGRHLVAEQRGMGADPVRHRQGGLVLVNINPAYRRSELEYALNKVGCRALILSPASRAATTWRCWPTWRPSWPLRGRPAARPRCPAWRS